MADQLAVLHLVDKCIKCGGCSVACQRNRDKHLTADDPTQKISANDVTCVKPQVAYDNPPYVKYNCWHCDGPLCAGASACPFNALKKQTNGAVTIDKTKCNTKSPLCDYQCAKACGRGGYPKIGDGDGSGKNYAYKCDLCTNADDTSRFLPGSKDKCVIGAGYTDSKVPACVATCPNGALKVGTKAQIQAYTAAGGFASVAGAGSFYWASSRLFGIPTSDPFVEDHVVPIFTKLLSGPAGKALAVPALALGGLYALYQRKETLKAQNA